MSAAVETPATKFGTDLPILKLDHGNGQRISVGATSVQSGVIECETVILAADCDLYFRSGANPEASVGAGSMLLFAGQTMPIVINRGDKIAAIRDSVSGHLTIMPVIEVA